MASWTRRLICFALAALLGLSGPAFWRGAGSSHAASLAVLDHSDGHGHSHSHDHDGDAGQHAPHGPDHSHVTLGLAQLTVYVFGQLRVAVRPSPHATLPLDVIWALERPPRVFAHA
jgi:hypothetical protein